MTGEDAVEFLRVCNLYYMAALEALTAAVSFAGAIPKGFRENAAEVGVELLFNGFKLMGRFFREAVTEVIPYDIYPVTYDESHDPSKETAHCMMEGEGKPPHDTERSPGQSLP